MTPTRSASCRRVVYADDRTLAEKERESVVSFSHNGRLRALRMPGNLWYKSRFAPDAEIGEIIAAGARLGVRRDWWPSSYSGLFHEPWGRPRGVGFTLKSLIPKAIIGAWQERRTEPGELIQGVREYDMNSAYAWAGFRSLPILRSAVPVRRFRGPGLYLCKIKRLGRFVIPPHLRNFRRDHWLTSEEIEELDLSADVLRGFTFARWWEPRGRLEKIREAAPNVWKAVFRAYWGSWASATGPLCKSRETGKTWTLPNILWDPVAAHYIVSRVRNKIAPLASNAVHIFSDAVITRDRFETGKEIGQWKMKNQFERVKIVHPGRWLGVTADGRREEKRTSAAGPISIDA